MTTSVEQYPVIMLAQAEYVETKRGFLAALEAMTPEAEEATIAGDIAQMLVTGTADAGQSTLDVCKAAQNLSAAAVKQVYERVVGKAFPLNKNGYTFSKNVNKKAIAALVKEVTVDGKTAPAWMFKLRAALDGKRALASKKPKNSDKGLVDFMANIIAKCISAKMSEREIDTLFAKAKKIAFKK